MIYTIVWQAFGAISFAAVIFLAVFGLMEESEGMEDEDSSEQYVPSSRPESRVAK